MEARKKKQLSYGAAAGHMSDFNFFGALVRCQDNALCT